MDTKLTELVRKLLRLLLGLVTRLGPCSDPIGPILVWILDGLSSF